jgi:nucleoid-associated protein YgaU
MRTDVKIGIAGAALILIIAVAYYGAKRNEGVALARGETGQSNPLEDLLGQAQKDKPAAPKENNAEKARPNRTNGARQPAQTRPQTADNSSTTGASRRQPVRRTTPHTAPQPSSTEASSVAAKEPQIPATLGPVLPPGFVAEDALPQAVGPQPAAGESMNPPVAPAAAAAQEIAAAIDAAAAAQPAPAVTVLQSEAPESPVFQPRSVTRTDAVARTHVVQAGDTFAAIAERYYGSERFTWKLMEANPGVDSRRLQIGGRLTIPALDGETPPQIRKPAAVTAVPPGGGQHYVVRDGDTFYGIASRELGSGERWREIYELNRTTVGGDPHQLKVGQELVLPKP